MSTAVEDLVTRVASRTGSSQSSLEKDLSKLTRLDVPIDEAEQTLLEMHSDHPASEDLFAIPGVGVVRGHFLYHSSLNSPTKIAGASTTSLAAVPYITKTRAPCIREAARDILGWSDTVAATVSAELSLHRTTVVEAYAKLAPRSVSPSEAEDTLRRYFRDADERSLFDIDGVGITQGHMLREAGFRTVKEVATSPASELEAARYIGSVRATKFKENAQRLLDESDAGRNDGHPSTQTSTVNNSSDGHSPDASSRNTTAEQSRPPEADDTEPPEVDAAERPRTQASNTQPDESADSPENNQSDWDIDLRGSAGRTSEWRTLGNSNNHDIHGSEPTDEAAATPSETTPQSTESSTYPPALIALDKWLLWKSTDDGRKIPRAPWATGDPLRFVDGMDPENWTDFETATEWQQKLPQEMGLAFSLSREDDVVFVDLDNVVDYDGEISQPAQDIIDSAAAYTAISSSGRGLHLFVEGKLSNEVKSVTGEFDGPETGSIEVYDRNRFVALTGNHLKGTPTDTTSAEPLIDDLEERFAAVHSSTPDQTISGPEKSRAELANLETTHSIQDIFDAIRQTRPSDIWLKSTQTKEHGDGTYSYDPSWTHSESGTRLGVLDDVWIYRKGMIALDAVQIVALEEGIIADERSYPSGTEFWDAVDELRERGATIPKYVPEDTPISAKDQALDPDAEPSKQRVLKILNRGQPVRFHTHPYDREYYERVALDIGPTVLELTEELSLPPAVAYRAAELFVKAQDADIIAGGSNERMLGAAARIATIEAEMPRPLEFIANAVGEDTSSVRNKMTRLLHDTDLSNNISASALFVSADEYVPFMASLLGLNDELDLLTTVTELLKTTDNGNGSPWASAAAAFYAVLKKSESHQYTQSQIATKVHVSEVTIRNNYRRYLQET